MFLHLPLFKNLFTNHKKSIMAKTKEVKTREAGAQCVETYISKGTKAKFKKLVKRNNTSQAQWLRDAIQAAVKGIR